MPSPTLVRLRRLWRDVHLWIGVGLFVVLVPLGLTGSMLAVSQPVGRLMEPQRYDAADGPAVLAPSAYAAAAKAALGPDAPLANLRFPMEPGDPVTGSGPVTGRKDAGDRPEWRTVWMDPKTAAVRDTGPVGDPVFNFAHRFHGSLMIPGVGRKIVGWLGWAMVLSTATGLWLWWPRGGNLMKGLRWRRSGSTFNNLHHMVGFWICIPLAIVSLTGVYISFPKTAQAMAQMFLPPAGATNPPAAKRPDRNAPPIASTRLTIDEATSAALEAQPGSRLLSVSQPTSLARPVWRIEVVGQDGDQTAYDLDDREGDVRRVPEPAPAQSLRRTIHDFHGGEGAGPLWHVLVFTTGVAPLLLGVTGLVMWLRRRRAKA